MIAIRLGTYGAFLILATVVIAACSQSARVADAPPVQLAPPPCVHLKHWTGADQDRLDKQESALPASADEIRAAVGELIDLHKQIDAGGLACPG